MSKNPQLHTCFSPALLPLYDLQDTIVVVIDVFRATSTIAAALHNGARYVIPVDSVADAIEISKQTGGIAAGERDGRIAEGLQYGNSPFEYSRAFIEGKILVLTTTNGTRLLHLAHQRGANTIITGSFPNLSAVARFLVGQRKNVLMGCAGWKDRFNMEDMIFAGAVISKVKEHFTIHCDSSLTACMMYEQHRHRIHELARSFTHYHRLVDRFGLIEDIAFCLTPDVADVLPVFVNNRLEAISG
jgi:2-phosphosulfolactate phosphatase